MENNLERTQPISQKQLTLIDKLIQTSKITKKERDYIVDKTKGKLKTTYDGKIFIEYLLAKIKFEKYFNGSRIYKKAHCFWCENKVGLERWEGNKLHDRIWVCKDCMSKGLDLGYSPTKWKKLFKRNIWDGTRNDEQLSGEEEEKYTNEYLGPDRDETVWADDPDGEMQENFRN